MILPKPYMDSSNNEDALDPPPPYTTALHMQDSEDEGEEGHFKSEISKQDLAYYQSSGKGMKSSVGIAEDGRINISMHLNKSLPDLPAHYSNPIREFAVDPTLVTASAGPREGGKVPRLNIVVMIVGSRGDVQPFLAIAQELLRQGHRVRIATHGIFRSFVTGAGPEFYDIGGDPHDLMSYMVKNPGLMPGWTSLTNGDIPRKQKMLSEILEGCWNACSQPDIDQKPFIADAIISNPPAFAHVHCAEALGIPLQLSFTMPWCSTTAFPHPLVNVSQSNAEPGLTNYLTYGLAEMMTWQGLGGVINEFRSTKLGLEPLTVRSGPGAVDRLKVPWTYCFSPELVPKPSDWQNHIDVVGFYFLDLASGYTPPDNLAAFLAAGPPPIYIGFGSVVVEDPDRMTRTIFEATERAGVRALVSVGWGGLGNTEVPPHIFLLGNVPHDWLFQRVFAVCHHGGAGTTAIGLRLGKPTIVCPFFGDQPFWGNMILRSGAGPKPIRKEKMSVERLTSSIEFCKTSEAREAAERLGTQIRAQNGVKNGVESFYRHLPVLNMRCDLLPDQLAVWWSTEHCLKLSAVVAQVLAEEKLLNIHKLEIHRSKEYDIRAKTSDPLTGGVVETLRCVTTLSESVVHIFKNPREGMIGTTIAIPRSIMHILDSLSDGLTNTPALYGSAVREPGRMKDFKSGMKEGGKAFFFGLSDGISGLWTEPVEGYKTGGWKGLVEGSMRSYVNVAMRPAAGSLSLITYPLRGALMSLNRQDTAMERHLRGLRVDQGRNAASATSGVPSHNEKYLAQEGEEEIGMPGRTPTRVRRIEESFDQHLRRLHLASPESVAMASPGSRAEIVRLFREACQKENITNRKKAMHKRIQWVITKGGAGSLTEMPVKEAAPKELVVKEVAVKEVAVKEVRAKPTKKLSKAHSSPSEIAAKQHQVKPTKRLTKPHSRTGSTSLSTLNVPLTPPALPTSWSFGTSSQISDSTLVPNDEWTKEDEELFSQQLEAARRLSLQPFGPISSADSRQARTYEESLLMASAQWSAETDGLGAGGLVDRYRSQLEIPTKKETDLASPLMQ